MVSPPTLRRLPRRVRRERVMPRSRFYGPEDPGSPPLRTTGPLAADRRFLEGLPSTSDPMEPADAATAEEFALRLEDHPFSFEARCLLQRGVGSAFLGGDPSATPTAVITTPWAPAEPMAFGSDPEQIWSILRELPGWNCVNLSSDVAPDLARVLERELHTPIRLYADLYFVLDQPPLRFVHPAVRRLTEDDLDLVERAPASVRPEGFLSTLAALSGGVAAGGIVGGELVSAVSMSTSSEEYANLVAHTLEPFRGQGLACAAGYLVARELMTRDLTPVWSTGEENLASQQVAKKLGFREFGRKTYVMVPSRRPTGAQRSDPGVR
jgi:hypothetical protein